MIETTCRFQCPWCQWRAETWAFLALRLFLGLRSLTAGLGKFLGAGRFSFANNHERFADTLMNQFVTQTWLPKFLLAPYLHGLAYVEVLLGACLLLGVRTRTSLAAMGLLYVSLGFGMMLMPPSQSARTVAEIGVHLALVVGALLLHRHNKFELWKEPISTEG